MPKHLTAARERARSGSEVIVARPGRWPFCVLTEVTGAFGRVRASRYCAGESMYPAASCSPAAGYCGVRIGRRPGSSGVCGPCRGLVLRERVRIRAVAGIRPGWSANPAAAAAWFARHGGLTGIPAQGWRQVSRSGSGATVESGAVTLHVTQGPDRTWQLEAATGARDSPGTSANGRGPVPSSTRGGIGNWLPVLPESAKGPASSSVWSLSASAGIMRVGVTMASRNSSAPGEL